MLISGLYGAKDENKIKLLVQTAKNGNEVFLKVKLRCTILFSIIIFVISIIPSIYGYGNILTADELMHRVNRIYEPEIDLGITLLAFLLLVYIIRGVVYFLLASFTTLMVRKTHNEFAVSVFTAMIVIIVSMILYFSKSNITMLLINIANRGI